VTSPLLRVAGLIAGYGRPVIGPVSLEIRPGEVVGLWGANGCGKSTLLNAITDRADVLAGSIVRAPGLTLAYQEQQPVRLPTMPVTGRELLGYAGATLQGMPPALQVSLSKRLDRLSGGQFQLLCVWAALAGDADLILLDEPTNNLDPDREALLTRMLAETVARMPDPGEPLRTLDREADRPNRAVLLVSHERRFLEGACSRLVEIG
jgi:ATPase subunit of ABC transporter with duplicated ATPase domains